MDNKVQEKLQELFIAFSNHLPNKILSLQTHWQELCEKFDPKSFKDFHHEVHTLTGSSGTYGYVNLSKMLRELEVFLKDLLDQNNLEQEQQTQITHLMSCLTEPASEHTIFFDLEISNTSSASELVYILDSDKYLKADLSNELEQMNYSVRELRDFSELLREVQRTPPKVLIIDADYLDEKNTNSLLVLQKQNDISLPLICTSLNGDFKTRLAAVRAICMMFLMKPIDVFYLSKSIEQMCDLSSTEAYRILIIDDSPSLANFYSVILQDEGMLTEVISNPMEAMNAISEFQPDLLLLDIYMPECSGIELAAIVRQEPKYTSLPIIFLSSEGDKFKQLAALSLGGDDFLTKPILPQHLISSIKTRAKRAGIINSYISRDSLTGLLKHSYILHQLEYELMRAERSHLVLTFAMIDIDHFKDVNDRFGHMVGDRVLKKLAEVLTSRLRRVDYIGRYGGEEFAIILPNTSASHGKAILDQLREKFSQIRFFAENTEFSVTFSGGIASFPQQRCQQKLIESADQALYRAKLEGRNRIVLF